MVKKEAYRFEKRQTTSVGPLDAGNLVDRRARSGDGGAGKRDAFRREKRARCGAGGEDAPC